MPSPPDSPMTFGNMREVGLRSLAVTCEQCHYRSVLQADRWGDAVLVRACGIIGRRRPAEPAGDAGERELAKRDWLRH